MTTQIAPINPHKLSTKRMLEHVENANADFERFNKCDGLGIAEVERMAAYRDEMAYHVNLTRNTRRAGEMSSVIASRVNLDIDHARNGVPVTVDRCLGTVLRYRRRENGYYWGTLHTVTGATLGMSDDYRTLDELLGYYRGKQ